MEIVLESFALKNVVHFDKAQVDIVPGITVILGKNLDSRISKQQNNGSGKSSLFGSIPNALLGSAPLATSRTAKKEMLAERGSRIDLNFKDYSITQLPSRWEFVIGGEKIAVRGTKGQQEKIRELVPLGEDEFYSYVYVQSQRDSFFQTAKADARLGFITRVFDLDNYDLLRKWLAKRLGEIKESEIRYSEIESMYLNLMQREQEIAWSDANDDEYAKLTKRVRKTNKRLQQIMRDIGEATAQLDNAERTERARKRFKELSESIDDPKASKAYAKEQQEANRLYSRYVREKKNYDTAYARITEKLEAIGETRPLKKLRKLHTRLSDQIEELREKERESNRLVERRTSLRTKIKAVEKTRASYPDKLIELKALKDEMAVCKTAISLKKLLHCDDGECPTCKQGIDIEALRANIKKAEKRITVLVEHELGHNAQDALDKLQKEYKEIPKVEVDELFYSSQIKDLTDKLNDVIAEGKRANSRIIYEEELASLKKPKKQNKPELSEKDADTLLHNAQEMLKLKDLIGKQTESPKKLAKRLKELESDRSIVEKKFNKANERWTELKMMRAELDVLTRERESAYNQLAELQPIIERKNIIKSLEKAYGKKGLKLLAANSILGLLERNLNDYSNLIFAEPFKFKVFADDKGVHCLVCRPNGKESDVRLLSGAESDCFRLLFMVAMYVMMPASKRTNFVVLDEPDSHMDDATRELFLNTFLPFLRTLVPSVNIITPFSTRYEADRVLRVVKSGGKATLEEL